MSDDEVGGAPRGKGEGELALDFPHGRLLRLGALGALLGFPGLGVWVALLVPTLFGRALSPGAFSALFVLTAAITLTISALLPPVLQRARAPRAARITWDREGITEHDGAHVRTAIRWLDARARIERSERGLVLQITDRERRAITLATPGAAPRWLARRKACTPELDRLARVLVDVEPGPEIAPDARDARRPTMGPQVALITLALGAVALPAMLVAPSLQHLARPFGALLVCLLCAAPALRPLHELLELFAIARRFERSDEAAIDDGEDHEAIVKRRDGTWLRLDLRAARHPDVWLATRADTVIHAVLPLAGWVPSPQRLGLGPSIPVTDVETAHERDVRRSIVRAAMIELAARGVAILWWGAASLRPLWEG